jgi:hypothetical protein
MTKMTDQQIEALLLKNQRELQKTQTELIKLKKQKEADKTRVKVTNILNVPESKHYDKTAVYSVYSKETGETSLFNGPQALVNEKYTDFYIIAFDHIMLAEEDIVGTLLSDDEEAAPETIKVEKDYDKWKKPQLDAELTLRGIEFNPVDSNVNKVALLMADDNK